MMCQVMVQLNLGNQKLCKTDLLYVRAIQDPNPTDNSMSLNVVKMWYLTHISLKQ